MILYDWIIDDPIWSVYAFIRNNKYILFQICIATVLTTPSLFMGEMGTLEGDNAIKDSNTISIIKYVLQHGTFILIIKMLGEYHSSNSKSNLLVRVLIIVAIIGSIISIWSYYEMAHLYTNIVGLRQDHKLVVTGPYQYIAHPGYLGKFMVYISALLFFSPSKILNIILLSMMIYLFYNRIILEERFLLDRLDGYTEYLQNHYRFISFVF